jgi:hypothetical protein
MTFLWDLLFILLIYIILTCCIDYVIVLPDLKNIIWINQFCSILFYVLIVLNQLWASLSTVEDVRISHFWTSREFFYLNSYRFLFLIFLFLYKLEWELFAKANRIWLWNHLFHCNSNGDSIRLFSASIIYYQNHCRYAR